MNSKKADLIFQGPGGRDEFLREHIADKVIHLLSSSIHISPMVIDGDWGTGKTEFCFKLIQKFENIEPSWRFLYVDAFQADHADNPLMTILSAVMKLLPEGKNKNALIKNSLPVIRFGLKTVAKAVVGHVLKQNADDIAEGLDKSIQEAADEAIDASVKALIKDHEKAEENLKALQDTLEKIAENNPIVIFIDELDRCRPDFAVQILEVIKHTFELKGLKFVLVTNTHQLKASINHRYGNQVNAQKYLDKFLKFSFTLPNFIPGIPYPSDGYALASVKHFSNLVKKSTILENLKISNDGERICHFSHSLIIVNNITLREVETFVRYLEIYQSLSNGLKNENKFGIANLKIFGVYVFCLRPEISNSIMNGKTDGVALAEILGINRIPDHKNGVYYNDATNLAVLLAQASKNNNNSYLDIESDAKMFWDEQNSDFFDAGNRIMDDIFSLIRDVIIFLQLGNQ